jgi:type VI secretion system secreted protein VgrG
MATTGDERTPRSTARPTTSSSRASWPTRASPRFFDHESDSTWTLVDPTSEQTAEHTEAIPFAPQSFGNAAPVPSIQTVEVTGKLKTSVLALQDYDHTNPRFAIKARETADGTGVELYVDEQGLEARHFAVGDVRTDQEADERAKRLLEATRVFGRRLMMTINTAVGAGTRITVSGHPRDDVNKPLLVVRSNFVAQNTASSQQVECIDKDTPYRPRHLPPPKIIGTQTARVVPQTEGKEIDASALGEVMVRFPWDHRDKQVNTSRFVRVSQAWAGQDYGLVCLPRVGDEVVVDFLDGDPDEPIIIGWLHNGGNVRPHNTPAEQTVSVWRSKSSPGGDGYNEILLDDKAGAERLDLRAQHDYHRLVLNDSTVYVKHNDFLTVDYSKADWIKRAYSMVAGSITLSTGPYLLMARTIKQLAKEFVYVKAEDYIMLECGASTIQLFPGHIYISSPQIQIEGGHIVMTAGMIDLNP